MGLDTRALAHLAAPGGARPAEATAMLSRERARLLMLGFLAGMGSAWVLLVWFG